MGRQGGPASNILVQTGGRVLGGPIAPAWLVPAGYRISGNASSPAVLVQPWELAGQRLEGGPPEPVAFANAGDRCEGGAAQAYYLVNTEATALLAMGPLAYWPLNEASGTTVVDRSGNGRNGTYTSVALGATGLGDGLTAATFNGTTSLANVFSTSLRDATNFLEGSVTAWFKVSGAGVYTDATARRIIHLRNAANTEFISLARTTTNNQFELRINGNGGATQQVVNLTTSALGWVMLGFTWSAAANQCVGYINGVQAGTAGAPAAWGAAMTAAWLGTVNGAAQLWSGNLAHVAIFPRALSSAAMVQLATPT